MYNSYAEAKKEKLISEAEIKNHTVILSTGTFRQYSVLQNQFDSTGITHLTSFLL